MARYRRIEQPIFRVPPARESRAQVKMTGEEFRTARKRLKLTQDEMGRFLAIPPVRYTVRAVAAWEGDERRIPPAVEKLVYIMLGDITY